MRYLKLDAIRGITLVSMILYHMVWDLVYLFQMDLQWYQSDMAFVWQQSICWSFVVLSGFCWPIGKRKLRRGGLVFGAGALISVITSIFMPDQRIMFGVLTLLGSCMLLLIPLEKMLNRMPASLGLLISILLFGATRNINQGFIGFFNIRVLDMPKNWYKNWISTFVGMPEPGFSSTDYFSLFPWVFLFLTGYFLYRVVRDRDLLRFMEKGSCSILEKVGRKSLIIYMVHQPLLYLGLSLLFHMRKVLPM